MDMADLELTGDWGMEWEWESFVGHLSSAWWVKLHEKQDRLVWANNKSFEQITRAWDKLLLNWHTSFWWTITLTLNGVGGILIFGGGRSLKG